ncbi:aldehyde dehydrogenase family protein [Rhodococcus opacus]|nr:aldehyde dehydrogenase family protein [Rhodococcus opacus]MDJ0420394.1 aldehyde dehydrogenase family protein [Rhodococcus opacus]MDV7088136.1 aldehyde dehydrogenase family protein [Rhodococcus opacus]UNN04712.1 aldehyde dehydrogenase family protein [Rhodococcus opacus]WKN52508.1 aldehyde dehydrogenase family protein [Rhodococcus opacus]
MSTTMPGSDTMPFPPNSVYIAGEWISSPDLERLPVLNPASEEVIGSIVDASPAEVEAAFAAARAALPKWSATAPGQRADVLDRLADAFREHGEELAVLASREIGMPIKESRAGQADLPERVLRSTADIARNFPWEARDASGTTVIREPVGVVLGITPWNFPVHQIVAKLAPALAAGCTIVLKPAELTPLNGLFVAALCERIGVPSGVVNVLTGRGATTGEALVQSGQYDLVSFTGSLAVGRHIGAVAGERVVRATLELGGKSPAVVLDDADVEAAVRATVRNCFTNAGQKCNAPTRLIVPEARREEAVSIAASAAAAYVLGDPLDENSTMGPLASALQREKVLSYVEGARARGARVAGGGAVDGVNRGYFVRPAIITDVEPDDPVVQEEIFGPVLVVLGHEGEDDAVRLANDTPYGLSAEVWSGNPARAADLARRIHAGQVRVNGVRTPALPISPFGGYKASGLGRELGPFGLEEYVEVKAVLGDPSDSIPSKEEPQCVL